MRGDQCEASLRLTREILQQRISYDPETGVFVRLMAPASAQVVVGKRAGRVGPNGRRQIGLFSKAYEEHRLAFLYMNGSFPVNDVDHINGNPQDNRWCNLREATRSENLYNSKRRVDNTSGFKGVSYDKKSKKWQAYLRVEKKKVHLGSFATPSAAASTVSDARKKFHGEFARNF